MKTITYNPETHVLVPREPTRAMCSAALAFENNKPLNEWGMIVSNTYEETYSAMLAAAPQPEPNSNWCAGCSPDNCSGCGAEPVYQICMADSVSLSGAWIDVDKQTYHNAGLYKEYKLRSLCTTSQHGRTAELEQLRARVAELEEENTALVKTIQRDTLTSLRRLAEREAENEWQPIETAPKDNTVFLAWRKHATHPLMVRYEPSYDWFANYDGEHVYDLTHWMPLPKPPAIDAAILKGEQK